MKNIENIKKLMKENVEDFIAKLILMSVMTVMVLFIYGTGESLSSIEELKYLAFKGIILILMGSSIFYLTKLKEKMQNKIKEKIKKEINLIEKEKGLIAACNNKKTYQILLDITPENNLLEKLKNKILGDKLFEKNEYYLLDYYFIVLNQIEFIFSINEIHEEKLNKKIELEKQEILKKEKEEYIQKKIHRNRPTLLQKIFGIKNQNKKVFKIQKI